MYQEVGQSIVLYSLLAVLCVWEFGGPRFLPIYAWVCALCAYPLFIASECSEQADLLVSQRADFYLWLLVQITKTRSLQLTEHTHMHTCTLYKSLSLSMVAPYGLFHRHQLIIEVALKCIALLALHIPLLSPQLLF